MNKETANLMSLGECDPELAEKIRLDIERIIANYISRNMGEVGSLLITTHQSNLERLALRALKNHLNNASNIY